MSRNDDVAYWKGKYQVEADRLAETLADLEELQRSSKELEDEFERELERGEQVYRVKIERAEKRATEAEADRDLWKVCLLTA